MERPVPMWPHAMLVTDRLLGSQVGDHVVILLQGHDVASAAATLGEAALHAGYSPRTPGRSELASAGDGSPSASDPGPIAAP